MDASETKLLTLKLKERGYSPKEIEKIWGGNILRVWKKVENIASKT
jgi:membrane dipeptidase